MDRAKRVTDTQSLLLVAVSLSTSALGADLGGGSKKNQMRALKTKVEKGFT